MYKKNIPIGDNRYVLALVFCSISISLRGIAHTAFYHVRSECKKKEYLEHITRLKYLKSAMFA